MPHPDDVSLLLTQKAKAEAHRIIESSPHPDASIASRQVDIRLFHGVNLEKALTSLSALSKGSKHSALSLLLETVVVRLRSRSWRESLSSHATTDEAFYRACESLRSGTVSPATLIAAQARLVVFFDGRMELDRAIDAYAASVSDSHLASRDVQYLALNAVTCPLWQLEVSCRS